MARCISPLRLKSEVGFNDVPCGRCNFCLQNKRKEWSFRLQKELRAHESAFFITLTYDDSQIPIIEFQEDSYCYALRKEDFQKFMKRLRKAHGKHKIKYFAVGEYGSNTHRPHYHALVFSMLPEITNQLNSIWNKGFVHVGSVTNDSIDYVTKYVINKNDFADFPVKPFTLISNGIGLGHFIQNQKLYKNETTVVNARGYPQVMPRYYRDKTITNPFTHEIIKQKNVAAAQEKERLDRERLGKIYNDPDATIYERKVECHDKITRAAKKNQKI